MEKLSKSIKLTPGKQKQLQNALDLLREHVFPVADIWQGLPQNQRNAVLANSPILAQLVEIARPFNGN